MKTRPAQSRTADLFAAIEASLTAVPAAAPPQAAARPNLKQLWYAVVFPELHGMEQSVVMLQRLCLHALRFTSFVSIEPPNALLLEIKGSLKLFGSLRALHDAIDASWQRLALSSRSATAPSTLAALWLARAGERVLIDDAGALAGHLAQLPIACTAWDVERLQTLRAMGVTQVGELLRLPRAGLARRFGPAAVLDLEIALARQPAPRRSFAPRERFRERVDFETEVENVAYLEKALEPSIERCARFLRERQSGVQRLQLKLRHRTEPLTCLRLGLASVTSERRRLLDVLCQKLTRLELKAPVRGMELRSGSLQPLSASSLDVFAGPAGAEGRDTAPQLVERLRARLGEGAVYGLCSIPEHRPEAAWRRIHELHLTRATVAEPMSDEGLRDPGMPRPIWLLGEPQPLSSLDKPPSQRNDLMLEPGPERIESGWWDGRGIARDYYVARRCGTKLWVFQERLSKRWYLHGVFA